MKTANYICVCTWRFVSETIEICTIPKRKEGIWHATKLPTKHIVRMHYRMTSAHGRAETRDEDVQNRKEGAEKKKMVWCKEGEKFVCQMISCIIYCYYCRYYYVLAKIIRAMNTLWRFTTHLVSFVENRLSIFHTNSMMPRLKCAGIVHVVWIKHSQLQPVFVRFVAPFSLERCCP